MKSSLLIAVSLFAIACSSTNCREARELSGAPPPKVDAKMDPMNQTSSADRVRVAKPDGSLQCNQGKAIPVSEMQKELKGITVHSAANLNDGLMRIQVCGSPTGQSNVYEIDRKDLAAATKLGFTEWTAE